MIETICKLFGHNYYQISPPLQSTSSTSNWYAHQCRRCRLVAFSLNQSI